LPDVQLEADELATTGSHSGKPRMRALGVLLVLAICAGAARVGAVEPAAGGAVAVLAAESELDALADLVQVALAEADLVTVERAALDAVLRERGLSASGVVDANAFGEAGRLLRAESFVLLSTAAGTGSGATGAKALVRVRLVETAYGVRLLDTFTELPAANPGAAAAQIADLTVRALAALRRKKAAGAIPVGIVDIHRVELGADYASLARVILALLATRLREAPGLVVLERENLKTLVDEKALTAGRDVAFWRSAALISGQLRRDNNGAGVRLDLAIARLSGARPDTVAIEVDPARPAAAAAAAANRIGTVLRTAVPVAAWDPAREAAAFQRQGELLWNHSRYRRAWPAFETALALQPDDLRCALLLFDCLWGLQNGLRRDQALRRSQRRQAGDEDAEADLDVYDREISAVDMAQLHHVTTLVPMLADAVQTAPETLESLRRGISARGVLFLDAYFLSAVSEATPEIRRTNRENRRAWAALACRRWQQVYGGDVDQNNSSGAILLDLALAGTDTPATALAQIAPALRRLVLMPEQGGKIRSPDVRHAYARAHLVMPAGPEYLANRRYRAAADRAAFTEGWLQLLREFAAAPDPLAKFAANIALAQRLNSTEHCLAAAQVLRDGLRTPHEPIAAPGREALRDEMKMCAAAVCARACRSELFLQIMGSFYEPLITARDLDNLLL